MKKFTALLISILMLSTLAFSCSNPADEITTNNTLDSNSEDIAETEPVKILPDLDPNDFGGYTFNILTRYSTSGDWTDWIPRDVAYDEEKEDVINDAVLQRNTYLEDTYNCKFEQKFTENFSGDLKKAINSGDNLYDIAYPGLRDTPALAQSGYFYNLYEVPNLDLSKPWWDQSANASLSIGGKLYFTSGDIMVINKDTCPGILFNKKLLESEALENPYQLVYNNEWTITKLYDMCKNVSRDLNGDGKMTYESDRYGFVGQRDTTMAIFHGTGEVIAEKDDYDYPYITFGSERAYRALEEYFNIIYDQEIAFNMHHLETLSPGTAIYPVSESIFMEDRALFMWVRLRLVENLRGMETDFGILPMPKLESTQSSWGHTVNSYTGCSFTIPMTANAEDVGFIAEAMAAESKYTTVPAYYDVSLKTKFSRDNESSEMLDIIFSSTVFDVGEIYNFGSFSGDLIFMSMTNDRNVTSKFEKASAKMDKDIEKCIEKYDKIDY